MQDSNEGFTAVGILSVLSIVGALACALLFLAEQEQLVNERLVIGVAAAFTAWASFNLSATFAINIRYMLKATDETLANVKEWASTLGFIGAIFLGSIVLFVWAGNITLTPTLIALAATIPFIIWVYTATEQALVEAE